jgi:hypothetical protein
VSQNINETPRKDGDYHQSGGVEPLGEAGNSEDTRRKVMGSAGASTHELRASKQVSSPARFDDGKRMTGKPSITMFRRQTDL